MELDGFLQSVWEEHGRRGQFEPTSRYDPDGDCLEFFFSDDAYLRERIDKWATAYRSRTSGELVGSMIKNVRELVKKHSGLGIAIESGPVRIAFLLSATALDARTPKVWRVYTQLAEQAAEHGLEAELQATP